VNDATETGTVDLWTRLRRRKVVQWGIAYLAAAWALLQGIAFLVDAFHWPEVAKQIATLVLLIGLPIALVLAWYHGDRGEQRISGVELAILVTLLLAGGGVLWWHQRAADVPIAALPVAAKPSVGATDARPSIAVLPFENRSRLEDDVFFVDGIHDDILTQLTKVGALRVIARTSVEQFRDTKLTTREIGERLGVTKVLEGGVQRAGDRVRVTVQLIDTASDAHVWAENYDRELSAANIFAIQSEVAAAIAGALKATLTPGERARVDAIPTQSLEAWKAYQLGRQRMASRTSGGLTAAEQHFRKALALDQRFALAWTGLADALALQVFYGGKPKDIGLREADQAASRALELNPELAEAWASAGNVAGFLNRERSVQLLHRAIELNPNYAPAHLWLSAALTELGRWSEALMIAERAVALDPLSPIINNMLGIANTQVGRFEAALAAFERAIEIDPSFALTYGNIGEVQAYGFGRLDTSIPWFEKAAKLDPGSAGMLSWPLIALWDLNSASEVDQRLAKIAALGEGTAISNVIASLVHLERGDLEPARRHAQLAANLDPWALFLIRDHDLARGDFAVAKARYTKTFPELLTRSSALNMRSGFAAIDLALVLQHTGETEQARSLLDRSEAFMRKIPRMGFSGSGISDVSIHALRGQSALALVKLREAEQAGWRFMWRYHRDFDPNLASIRNEPEFKAIFADIERDMARQRAELEARQKEAASSL
jgi:TolB-like protein